MSLSSAADIQILIVKSNVKFLTHEMIEHCKDNVNENRKKLAYFMLSATWIMKSALNQTCALNWMLTSKKDYGIK